jgi:molecular chaperone GrpE
MADENGVNPAEIEPDAQAPDSEPQAAAQAAPPPTGLEILKRERDDYYDRLLRQTAEFENYRKRIERERRAHADQAVADLLRDLLLVVDDFDRALASEASDASGSYRKGVELIHTKLQDLLRKQGVRPIDALGVDFDPNLHEAVLWESSPDHREGEVIGEVRRGYTLGDRLLRPSLVKVAKA